MNVYDFDNTIFRGDSTARFYAYCLMRTPRMLARLPALAYHALFTLRRDKQAFKAHLFRFLTDLSDPEDMVARFWRANTGRVKRWYITQKQPDDVIISASPEFLIAPVCAWLGLRVVLASPVNARTGAYSGANCHGEEKVRRFREALGDAQIDEFYSDSLSDAPLARLAHRAYLVKGDARKPWPLPARE